MAKVILVLLVLCSAIQVYAVWIPIENVVVSPVQPSVGEDVLIFADGLASTQPAAPSTEVSFGVNAIVLDIFFSDFSDSNSVGSWDLTENIGMLNMGSYGLTINTYNSSRGTPELADSFQTSFDVIPEPSTISLFAIGGLLVYSRKKNRERSLKKAPLH